MEWSADGRMPEDDDSNDEIDEDDPSHDNDDDDGEDDGNDPFGAFGGLGGPPPGLSSTLRALSGLLSGMSTRLRDIVSNLKRRDDPSMQMIALQELSEIFLVSTEDNLSGHFSPDAVVKELVALMQPSDFGEENPEMMLLACRCLSNLMEALPASTANVVYGGAVPVLCQKLLEIHFIDLAEQALSVCEVPLHRSDSLLTFLDPGENIRRVSHVHCSRRRPNRLSHLPRLLCYKHATNGCDDGSQLL